MEGTDAFKWLGGRREIRRTVSSELAWSQVLQEGLPTSVIDLIIETGKISAEELYQLVIPRRTLSHRRKASEALSKDESDRLARVARVMAFSERTFQNDVKSHTWMRRSNRALGGSRPLDLLETEQGARVVETVLGRVAHGVFS